jgi:acyl-CoA thioester hydrolase
MYQSETTVRVRYGETDQMAYVYYGNYAMYYEVARVESFRQLGVTYKELEAMGVMMPVLEYHSKFLAPGRYDELLRIRTTIPEKPTVKIRFTFETFNEENKLINQGEALLAFITMATGRPCRPPELLMKPLEPYFK